MFNWGVSRQKKFLFDKIENDQNFYVTKIVEVVCAQLLQYRKSINYNILRILLENFFKKKFYSIMFLNAFVLINLLSHFPGKSLFMG